MDINATPHATGRPQRTALGRFITSAVIVVTIALAFAISGLDPPAIAEQIAGRAEAIGDPNHHEDGARLNRPGQDIFRYDTFGDEQLWTGVLRMHEALAAVPPVTALGLGLKVDVQALPRQLRKALRAGQVDLTSPAVTVELLRLNAVIGVQGTVNDTGELTSVGITCALCHSAVDNSFAPGIGRR